MFKWASWLAAAALIGSCAAADFDYAYFSPAVEARGIWLDAHAIPRSAPDIRRLVRSYRDLNINVIFPEMLTRGYAVYQSGLLARDPRFRNAPDPLPILISEAHALGIEVHPWVWVFRTGHPTDPGAILTAHPDWAELSKDGSQQAPSGGFWISPAIPAARDFIADLLAELVRNYDIDGLHLDYIRYESESSASYGYSAASRALFEKQYGVDPALIQPSSIEQYEWVKFRERQVNTFVQRIAIQTRSAKPWVKISAAVSPNLKSARLDLMQNWVNWVDNKWLDFVVPMTYAKDESYLRRLLSANQSAVGNRTLLFPGIGLYLRLDPSQTARQIGVAREELTAGQVLFSASYLKSEYGLCLKHGPYARRSTLPFRDPGKRVSELKECADLLSAQGRRGEADYLLKLAASLEAYSVYRETPIPYVPPSAAPMTVRQNYLR